MIRVALADDHKLFTEGIGFLLSSMKGVELVLEVANGLELLEQIDKHKPDILLLDLDMPEMDGLEVLKQLKPQNDDLGVIILTMHDDPKMISYLMELGANGYLLKDTSPDEFRKAIFGVFQEGFYFNQIVSTAMLSGLKSSQKTKPTLKNNSRLTEREVEVLQLICEELRPKK